MLIKKSGKIVHPTTEIHFVYYQGVQKYEKSNHHHVKNIKYAFQILVCKV
jgi:hypothetical protein